MNSMSGVAALAYAAQANQPGTKTSKVNLEITPGKDNVASGDKSTNTGEER